MRHGEERGRGSGTFRGLLTPNRTHFWTPGTFRHWSSASTTVGCISDSFNFSTICQSYDRKHQCILLELYVNYQQWKKINRSLMFCLFCKLKIKKCDEQKCPNQCFVGLPFIGIDSCKSFGVCLSVLCILRMTFKAHFSLENSSSVVKLYGVHL